MTFEEKREYLDELATNEEITIMFPDGYEDALLGHTVVGTKQTVPVYDYDKCIACLVERDGMEYEEAIEFFDYNTARACEYLGDECPIFVNIL